MKIKISHNRIMQLGPGIVRVDFSCAACGGEKLFQEMRLKKLLVCPTCGEEHMIEYLEEEDKQIEECDRCKGRGFLNPMTGEPLKEHITEEELKEETGGRVRICPECKGKGE